MMKRKIIITETTKNDIDIEYFIKGNNDDWVKSTITNKILRDLFNHAIHKIRHHKIKPNQIAIRDKDDIRTISRN